MRSGTYTYVPIERVLWGIPAREAILEEIDRLSANRVLLVTSKTLARTTDVVSTIQNALAEKCVGHFEGCLEHTPIESVLSCAADIEERSADLVVTIGGGTPIDTVKIAQVCQAFNIRSSEELLKRAGQQSDVASPFRQIIVPTTLSGGEYSSFAGGTDPKRKIKDMYYGPDLCGRTIIADPEITLHTPDWLWFSTAIRALDHAIEGYCAPETNALVQGTALHAIKLFSESLRRTKRDRTDLDARHKSQMAVWLATSSLGRVSMGASHGIGYFLGTMCNVPHGYTSCVMLPAVLKWNSSATENLQKDIASALGAKNATAAEAVGALLDDLEMPRNLTDIGVSQDMFEPIAAQAVQHPVVQANPRPITSVDEVIEILNLANE